MVGLMAEIRLEMDDEGFVVCCQKRSFLGNRVCVISSTFELSGCRAK